jgi:hypothetical protein
MIRAFADDTAMVVENFHRFADTIYDTFQKFGGISGLRLNLPKTILVPLWPTHLGGVRRMLADEFPAWAKVKVDFSARYLGFLIGPESAGKIWDQAMIKYNARCLAWRHLRLGLQYDARVYRTFCISVLGFLWQLARVPPEVLDAEAGALRKFAPGPGNWATPLDLFCLQSSFGFTFAFQSVETSAIAAKLRVAQYENLDLSSRTAQ